MSTQPQQLNILPPEELQDREPEEIVEGLPLGLHENMEDLFEIAGNEVALKLCQHFAGQNVYFPTLRTLSKPFRDRAIREKWRAGLTVGQLAREFGLSESQVRRIIAGRDDE